MSKLGFYFGGKVDLGSIVQARPRILTVMDDPAALQTLNGALRDRCILVTGTAALGSDWGTFWRSAGEDPARALELWWEAARPGVEAAPFAFWTSFIGPRERGLASSFAAFEAARVERLALVGARACVGNFSSGLPDPRDPVWKEFFPACRAAHVRGGILGVQEFGALYLWTGYGSNTWTGNHFRAERKFPEEYREDADLCLHYRQVYRDLLNPAGLGALPLAITACGLGATANVITAALSPDGQPTSGWQTCIPTWNSRDGIRDAADFYVRQLQWYDVQIERDPVVLGAAVYGWGIGGGSDIDGRVAELLLAHIAAGPHPTAALRSDSPGGETLPPVTPSRHRSAPSKPHPAGSGKWYYIAVNHPEIFDSLWRQGEGIAEAVQATLTWRETKGRFFIQTDDVEVWQQLYLYGQMLAQAQNAEIVGGEIDAPKTS